MKIAPPQTPALPYSGQNTSRMDTLHKVLRLLQHLLQEPEIYLYLLWQQEIKVFLTSDLDLSFYVVAFEVTGQKVAFAVADFYEL